MNTNMRGVSGYSPKNVSFENLSGSDLVVDSVYISGSEPNLKSEVLSKLLPVGNVGGFRWSGTWDKATIVLLTSNSTEPLWPDAYDPGRKILRYFGDNRSEGELLETRGGNRILESAFRSAEGGFDQRLEVPVFLYFERWGKGRDWIFRGLAVPGHTEIEPSDFLQLVWSSSKNGKFANYLATFTILDIPIVSRVWIEELLAGQKTSNNAPIEYHNWLKHGTTPL
jgi:hypothetical protein